MGRGKLLILGEQLNGKGRGEQSKLDSAGRGRRYLGSSPKLGEGDRRGAVVEGCVEIPFEWDGGSGDDEVYVYAYCPEMEEGVLSASAWRRSGRVQLTLPERWQGKEIHLYGFAVDEKGAASATVYIGALSPMETRQAASLQGEMSVETDFSMRENTKNFSSTSFNKKDSYIINMWMQHRDLRHRRSHRPLRRIHFINHCGWIKNFLRGNFYFVYLHFQTSVKYNINL